jgi:hypothetical protein
MHTNLIHSISVCEQCALSLIPSTLSFPHVNILSQKWIICWMGWLEYETFSIRPNNQFYSAMLPTVNKFTFISTRNPKLNTSHSFLPVLVLTLLYGSKNDWLMNRWWFDCSTGKGLRELQIRLIKILWFGFLNPFVSKAWMNTRLPDWNFLLCII